MAKFKALIKIYLSFLLVFDSGTFFDGVVKLTPHEFSTATQSQRYEKTEYIGR